MTTAHEINGVPGTLQAANNDGSGALWTSELRDLGSGERMRVEVRYSRIGSNKHRSFGITGSIYRGRRPYACGCLHADIEKHFPELAYLIDYHLCDDEGPLHYLANTTYWAEQGEFDKARRAAHWPGATEDQLQSRTALALRLPEFLERFRAALSDAALLDT